MQVLYPAIKAYAKHRLKVTDLHELYVEETGNPKGIPILVIHSGPGAGSECFLRRFFDPERFHIILFDQRGCGQSTPHAELQHNTTHDLVQDIETIREFLGIKQWILWGGAWGSTLALLYAQAFPDCVSGLIVHSVFLGRQADIDWFYKAGANQFFPEYWEDFMNGIPDAKNSNILNAYSERLQSADELARMSTAKAWSLWQARCTALQPHHEIIDHFADPHVAVSLAHIETYYLANRCFIAENQILDNMSQIAHIPGFIIHGRYNMVSPLINAWTLHRAWPTSDLFIVRDAGHSSKEPGIIDANIHAMKKMAKYLLHGA